MSQSKKTELINQRPKRCLVSLNSPRPDKEAWTRNKLSLPRAMSTIVEENLNMRLRDVNQNVLELLDAAERCGRCASKASLVASTSTESKRTDSKVSAMPDTDPSATTRDIKSLTFCSSRKSRSFHFTTSRHSSSKIEDDPGNSHKYKRRHSATSKSMSKKSLSNSDIYKQNFTVYPVHAEFFMRREQTGSNTAVSKHRRDHEQRQPSILSGILRKSILNKPNEYKTVGVNVCHELKNMIKDSSPFRKSSTPTSKHSDVSKTTKHHPNKESEKHHKKRETKRRHNSSKHFLEQYRNISPSSSLDDYRLYQRKSLAKNHSEYKLDHGRCPPLRKSHHKEKQPKKRARHTASHDKMHGPSNHGRENLDKYADMYLERGDFKKLDTKLKTSERSSQKAHSPAAKPKQNNITKHREKDEFIDKINEKRDRAKCESSLIRIKQSLLKLTGFNKRSKSKATSKHSDKATGRSPGRKPTFDAYTMSIKVPSINNVQRFFQLDNADLLNLCSCEPMNSLQLKPTITRAELGSLEIPPYKPKKHESRRRRKHNNEGPSVETWTMPCPSTPKEPAIEKMHVHNSFLPSYDSCETAPLCKNLSATSLAETTNMMTISEICNIHEKTMAVPKNKQPEMIPLNPLSYNEYKKFTNPRMLDTLSITPRIDKYASFLMEPYCYMSCNSIQTEIKNKSTNTGLPQVAENNHVTHNSYKASNNGKQLRESVQLLTDEQTKRRFVKVESEVNTSDVVYTDKKCGPLPKSKIPVLMHNSIKKKYLASLEVPSWVDVNQKRGSILPRTTNLEKSCKKDSVSAINKWERQAFGFDLDKNFLENMIKSKENINLEEEVFDLSWSESECILKSNNDNNATLQSVEDLEVPLESNKVDSSMSKLLFKTRNKFRKHKDKNGKVASNKSKHDLKIEKIDFPQNSNQSHATPDLKTSNKNTTFIVNLADLDPMQRNAISSNSKALLEDSLRQITSKINLEHVKKHVRERDMQSVSLQVLVPSNNVDTNTSNHFIPNYVVRRSSPGKSKLPIPIDKHKQSIKKTYTFPIEIDLAKIGMGEEIGSNVNIEDLQRAGNRRATEGPNKITNNPSFHEQIINNLQADKIDKCTTKLKFSSIRLKLFSLRWWRGILSKKTKEKTKKNEQKSLSLTLSKFQEIIELPGHIVRKECQMLVMERSKSTTCLSNSKSMVVLPILRSLSDTSVNLSRSISHKICKHKLLILQYQEEYNPLTPSEQHDALEEEEVMITNYDKIPSLALSSSEKLTSSKNPTYKTKKGVNYSCCQRYQKPPKKMKTIYDKPPAHVHNDSEFEATRKMLHLSKPEDYYSIKQEAKQEVQKKIHELEDRIIEREKEHVLKEDKRKENIVLRKLNQEAEQFREEFEDIYTPITRCDFGMTYYNFRSQLRHFLLETDTLRILTPCVKGHMQKAPPEIPLADVEPVLVNVTSQVCEEDLDTMVGEYIFPDIENIIVDKYQVDSNSRTREMQDLENQQGFLYEIHPDYSVDSAEVTVKPLAETTSCDCTKQYLNSNISLNDDITISLSAYPSELEIHVVYCDTEFKIIFCDDTFTVCDCDSDDDVVYKKQRYLEKLYKKLSKRGKLLRRIRDVLVYPTDDLIGSDKYRELAIAFIEDVNDAVLGSDNIYYFDAVKIKKLVVKYRKLPRKIFSSEQDDLNTIAEVSELPTAQYVESDEKVIKEDSSELPTSDNSKIALEESICSSLLSAKNSYSCTYLDKYVNTLPAPLRISKSCICLLNKRQPLKKLQRLREDNPGKEIETGIGDDGLDKVADLCRRPFYYTRRVKPENSCQARSKLDQFCNTRDIVPAPIERYFFACSQVRVRHPPILWLIAKSIVTKRKKYRPKLFRRRSRHRRIHCKKECRQDSEDDSEVDVEPSRSLRESNCCVKRQRRKMSKCCSTSRCHSHRRRHVNHLWKEPSFHRGSDDDNSGHEHDGCCIVPSCSNVKNSCASFKRSLKCSSRRSKGCTVRHQRYPRRQRQRCKKKKSCDENQSCASSANSSMQLKLNYIEDGLNTTTSEETGVSYLKSRPDLPAEDVQVSPDLNAPPPHRNPSEPVVNVNVNPSLTLITMCNTSCNAVVPTMEDCACGHSNSSNDSKKVEIAKIRKVDHVKKEKKQCGCSTTNSCGKKTKRENIKHNPSPKSTITVDSVGSQVEISSIDGDAVLVLDTEPGELEKENYSPETIQSVYKVTTQTILNPDKAKISMSMLTETLNQQSATCSYTSSQIQALLSLKPAKPKKCPWYKKMTFKRNPKNAKQPNKKPTIAINYPTLGNILPGIAQTSITILPTFHVPLGIFGAKRRKVRCDCSLGKVQELLPPRNLQSSAETSLLNISQTEVQSPFLHQVFDSIDNISPSREKFFFRKVQGQKTRKQVEHKLNANEDPTSASTVVVKFTAHTLNSIDSDDVPMSIREPHSCDACRTLLHSSKCHHCKSKKEKTKNDNIRMMTVEELPDTLDKQLLKAVNLDQLYLYAHYVQTDYDLYIQSNTQSISMANYFPCAFANEPDISILSSVPTVSRFQYKDLATEQFPRSKLPQTTSYMEKDPVAGCISKSKMAGAVDKVSAKTAFSKLKETLFTTDGLKNIRHKELIKIDKPGHVKYPSKVKDIGTDPDTAARIKKMHSTSEHNNKIVEKFSEKETKNTGVRTSTFTKTITTPRETKYHEHTCQTDPQHHEKVVKNTTIKNDMKTGNTVEKVETIQIDPDCKTITKSSHKTEHTPKYHTMELLKDLLHLKHAHAETMTCFDKDNLHYDNKSNLKPVVEDKSAQVTLVKHNFKCIQFPQQSQFSTAAEESGPFIPHSASQTSVTPLENILPGSVKRKQSDDFSSDGSNKKRKHDDGPCCSTSTSKKDKSPSPARDKSTCCGESLGQHSSPASSTNHHKKSEDKYVVPESCCRDKIDKQVSVRPKPQIIIDNLASTEKPYTQETEKKCCKSANTSNTSKYNFQSRVRKEKSVSYYNDRRYRKFRNECHGNTGCVSSQKMNWDTACRRKHRHWIFKDCCDEQVKNNFYTQTRKKFRDTHYECCMPKEDIIYTPHCAWPNRKGCDEVDCVPKGCEHASCSALRRKCQATSCNWPAVRRKYENSSCTSVRNYGWKGCCAHVKKTPKYVFKDCCDDDIIKDFYKMGQDRFMKVYPPSCWPRLVSRFSDEVIDTYYDMKSSGASKPVVDSETAGPSKHKSNHEIQYDTHQKQLEYIFNDCCDGETIEIFHKVGMEEFKKMYPQCCWPQIIKKVIQPAGTHQQASHNESSTRLAKPSELLTKYEYILKECCGEKEKALLSKLGFDKFAQLYPQCCVPEKGANKDRRFLRQYDESAADVYKTCCVNYNRKHCNRRSTCYDYETDDAETLIEEHGPRRTLHVTPSKYYFKPCCDDGIKTDFYKKGEDKFKKENPSCCWPVKIDMACCDYTPSEWKTLVHHVKDNPELKKMLPKFCDEHAKKLAIEVGKYHKSSDLHQHEIPSVPPPSMATIQSVGTSNSGPFHQAHDRTIATGNDNMTDTGYRSKLIEMKKHHTNQPCACKKKQLDTGEIVRIKSDHCHCDQHNVKGVRRFKCLCKKNKLDTIKGHFCMDDTGKCPCKKHPTHKHKHCNKATTYTATNVKLGTDAFTERTSMFSLLDQIDNYFGPPRSISEPIMINLDDRYPQNTTNNFNMFKPTTFIKSLMPFGKTNKLTLVASHDDVPYNNKSNKSFTLVKMFNPQVLSFHSKIQVNDDEEMGTLFERKRESKVDFSHVSPPVPKPVHTQDEKNIKFLEEVELIDYKRKRKSKNASFKAEPPAETQRSSLKQTDVAVNDTGAQLSDSKVLLSKPSLEPDFIRLNSREVSPKISEISPPFRISNWSLTSDTSLIGKKSPRISIDNSPTESKQRSSTKHTNGPYASIEERRIHAKRQKLSPPVLPPEPPHPSPPIQGSETTIEIIESDDSETQMYTPMPEVHYEKKSKSIVEWMISKLTDLEKKTKMPRRKKLIIKPTILTKLFKDRKEGVNASTSNHNAFPCGCSYARGKPCNCNGHTNQRCHCKAKKKKQVVEYSFVDNTNLYAGNKSLHKIRQTSYRSIFEMIREESDENKYEGQACCKVYEAFPKKEECVMNSKRQYGINLSQEIAIGGAGQCASTSRLSTIAEKTEHEPDGTCSASASEEMKRDLKEIMHIYNRLNQDSSYECIGLHEQLGNRLPHILTQKDYEPDLNNKDCDYVYPTTVRLPMSTASINLERKSSKIGRLIKKVKCSLSRLKLRRVKHTTLPIPNIKSPSSTRQADTTTKKIHYDASLKSMVEKASKTNSVYKEEIQIGGTSYIIRAPRQSRKGKHLKSQQCDCDIPSVMSLNRPQHVDVANNADFNITNSKFDMMKELIMQKDLDKVIKLQEEIDWINQRIAGKYRDSALKVLLDASMQVKKQLEDVICNSTQLNSTATLTKPTLSEKAVEVINVSLYSELKHQKQTDQEQASEEIEKEKPAKQDPNELITFRESILKERERIRKEELTRKKEAFVEVLRSGRETLVESEISSTSTDTCALVRRRASKKCKIQEEFADDSCSEVRKPKVSKAAHLLVENISSESGSILHNLKTRVDVLGTYVPDPAPVYPVMVSSHMTEQNASGSEDIDSEKIKFEAQNFTWDVNSSNISVSSLNHTSESAVENILVPTNTAHAYEPTIMLVPNSKQPQKQKRKKCIKKATKTLRLRLKFLPSSNEREMNSPQPYLVEQLSETSYSDDNEYVLNVYDYQKRGSVENSPRCKRTDTNLSNVRLLSGVAPSRNESTAHSYHNRYDVESYSMYESRQTQRHRAEADNSETILHRQNTHMSDKHKYNEL